MVIPTPPWGWIACCPRKRPDRPICTLPAAIARRRSSAFPDCAIMAAHDALFAVEIPALAVTAPPGRDVGEVVARMALRVAERQAELAGRDLRQNALALFLAAAET